MSSAPPPTGRGRDGAHPAGEQPRKRRPWWILAVLAALIAVALVLLLSRCGSDSGDGSDGSGSGATTAGASGATRTSSASPSSAAPTPRTTPASSAAPAAPGAPTGPAGAVTANGAALLPLAAAAAPDGTLAKYAGQPVQAAAVVVQSAPVANGFWIGTSTTDRIWVQLLEEGLVSPHPVRAGDHVTFAGKMVANPAGFAATAGATGADATQLTAQGAHIETAKSSITFTG